MAELKAIILAAGYSSRMGTMKALLPFAGSTLIKKQIASVKNSEITDITVVSGFNAESIKPQAGTDASVVYNPDFRLGMFTSIQAGAASLKSKSCGFLILPVDCALIRPYMIKLLTEEYFRTGCLVFPSFGGKRGHPPVLPGFMIQKIIEYCGENGARGLFRRFNGVSCNLNMPNGECLIDMDNQTDYEKACKLYARSTPTEAECRFLLKSEHTPEKVIAHCEAVSRAAGMLAEAVAAKGVKINKSLVCSAALLHDINKTENNHAEAGARTLLNNGFGRVAQIIRNHMNIGAAFLEDICEESVLYLADKLTEGKEIKTLDERYEKFIPQQREFAKKKLGIAAKIKKQIETICETSVYNIFGKEKKG